MCSSAPPPQARPPGAPPKAACWSTGTRAGGGRSGGWPGTWSRTTSTASSSPCWSRCSSPPECTQGGTRGPRGGQTCNPVGVGVIVGISRLSGCQAVEGGPLEPPTIPASSPLSNPTTPALPRLVGPCGHAGHPTPGFFSPSGTASPAICQPAGKNNSAVSRPLPFHSRAARYQTRARKNRNSPSRKGTPASFCWAAQNSGDTRCFSFVVK